MSALARYYCAKGWVVSGSDMTESDITRELRVEGMAITIGHVARNVPLRAERVVRSAAVEMNNPEMKEARKQRIPVMSYAEALGELTKQYITLAVAGTHGKSTTTALLALMLIKAGLDPTVIVGTRLAEFGGKNMRIGKSRYLVIEADEYDRSFLQYTPTVAVVTNVDADHLDTYGTLSGVIAGFRQYLHALPKEATVIVNAEDKNSMRAARGVTCRLVMFNTNGKLSAKWPLKIPGYFNQLNAEAAWTVARVVDVTKKIAMAAVRQYRGSWRRMEPLTPIPNTTGVIPRGIFFADYAHHPNEIKATIGALREKYPRRKLLVIFQPHQQQRLTKLFTQFVGAFVGATLVGILPTYQVAGREAKTGRPAYRTGRPAYRTGRTAEELCRALAKKQDAVYLNNFDKAGTLIDGQVVVFMGAGSIDSEVRKYFKSKLLKEGKPA